MRLFIIGIYLKINSRHIHSNYQKYSYEHEFIFILAVGANIIVNSKKLLIYKLYDLV